MSQRHFLGVIVALVALRLATLWVLPVLDPSEARYAVVARDMLESGDFVTPHIWANGEYVPFFSKPPLPLWLQALSMRALGVSALAARVPSFLASIATLLATWLFLRRRLAADVARGAVLILMSCPLFFIAAGLGLTDMVLCAAVSSALFSHYRFTVAGDPSQARRFSLMTFSLLGVGMMAKGPIALVEFGLPTLAWTVWNRRPDDVWRQAWWPGLLLFVLAWLPWYWLAERANPGFLEYFLVHENFLRFVASSYGDRYGGGHKFPPGAAVVFFLLACLPWLLLLAWHLRHAAARRRVGERLRAGDVQLFSFAVGLNVVFLSFARHILGTYVLPILPAAAVVLSALFASVGVGIRRLARIAAALVVIYAVAVVAGGPFVEANWSARRVLARAAELQRERGAHGRTVFVEKRPFSARFYGGPEVDHVPWDAGNEHFEWYLQPENGHLLILRSRHPAMLDPYVTSRLRLVERTGRYSIWAPTPPR